MELAEGAGPPITDPYHQRLLVPRGRFLTLLVADAEEAQILEWFAEFDGPCSTSRQVVLAAQLSHAMEGFMDVDKELLSQAFLLEQRKRKGRRYSLREARLTD